MKGTFIFAAATGLLAIFPACAEPTRPAEARGTVEVMFDHPENFTDVKDSSMPTERGRDSILGQFRAYLVENATTFLPPGYSLSVTFTDIDLAGKYEPWRGPQWDDVRIVKSVYPPCLTFKYVLKDPAGKVAKQGSESIRDASFQMRSVPDSLDPLRYEKAILSDWIHDNLRNLR